MSTPLFLRTDNQSPLETLLIGVSGRHNGDRLFEFNDEITLEKIAVTDTNYIDFGLNEAVINAMASHNLSVWKMLEYAFIPGPGCFGRIVTLYTGWCSPGDTIPKTASEFRTLPGYTVTVCGGTGDPQFNRGWLAAPFSSTRHKIIRSRTLKTNGALRLCWYLDSNDVSKASGGVKGSGPLFFVRTTGLFDVYGDVN